jgi:hypothetical protein
MWEVRNQYAGSKRLEFWAMEIEVREISHIKSSARPVILCLARLQFTRGHVAILAACGSDGSGSDVELLRFLQSLSR